MIAGLIRVRGVTFAAAIVLLVLLIAQGKRVSYEQSIQSFFADNDPAMAVYRRASAAIGDDNFVFLAYDDPDLLTPAGINRVASLAAMVSPAMIDGVARIESLDAMPLLWTLDDLLIALDKLPFGRETAIKAIKDNLGKLSGGSSPLTIGAALRSGNPELIADVRARVVKHPLFRSTLIDATGTTTAIVARLRKSDQHDVKETIRELRLAVDTFATRNGLGHAAVVGPPVLLADAKPSLIEIGR